MGNPTFYYYPVADGLDSILHTVELDGLFVSDLEEVDPILNQSSSMSISGRETVIHWGTIRRYRIVLESFQDTDLAREFRNFLQHAMTGGAFGFSVDHAKSYAGYCKKQPTTGSSSVFLKGLGFYNRSATLSAGDEIVLLTGAPECNYEICEISSSNSTSIGLADPIRYEYASDWTLARYRYFFPVCRISAEERGKIALRSERQLHWSFEVVIEEDLAGIDSLQSASSTITDSTVAVTGGSVSLEAAIAKKTNKILGQVGAGTPAKFRGSFTPARRRGVI